MSQRLFSIDKTLYEILTESPSRAFKLHGLRVEYSSRSGEWALAPNIDLFWQIYMQIQALKSRKLIRREESPSAGGIFFLEQHFWDNPFNIVEGLFLKRRS